MGEASEKLLGKAIQESRQSAGLTQQALCQQAGISYSTLAKIERGAIKTPSVFTVARIAQVLGRSMDDLMGVVVDVSGVAQQKKTSKNGISFLYVDINGCLVRFFHAAFTQISHETGVPSDVVESTFWHYNDAVCRGEMPLEDFNTALEKQFNYAPLDWTTFYMQAVQPINDMHELVVWASQHYRVGLLSNIMPGFIDQMIANGLLPDVGYDVIIDSSQVGQLKPEQEMYETAEKHANVDPAEILFIDDSRTNLMAAERRGWKVMWFDDYDPAESTAKIRNILEF